MADGGEQGAGSRKEKGERRKEKGERRKEKIINLITPSVKSYANII
jgi:hypothetical protein